MLGWYFSAAALSLFAGGIVTLVASFRFRVKRYLHWFETIVLLYLAGMYGYSGMLILVDRFEYLPVHVKSGAMVAIGVIFLATLFIAEIVADWNVAYEC